MTVVRKCDNPQGGVKCIRKVYQLMERCDAHGGIYRSWGGVTVVRKCASKLFQENPRCSNTLDIQKYSSSEKLEISRNYKL